MCIRDRSLSVVFNIELINKPEIKEININLPIVTSWIFQMKYLKEVFCLLFVNNKIWILTIKKTINIQLFILLFILKVNYLGYLNSSLITNKFLITKLIQDLFDILEYQL